MSDPRTQIGVARARRSPTSRSCCRSSQDRPRRRRRSIGAAGRPVTCADADDDAVARRCTAARRRAAATRGATRRREAAPPEGGHAITVEIWHSYGDEAISYDLLRRWDALPRRCWRFGERFDVILSPVFPTPAPPHGELSSEPDRTHYTNAAQPDGLAGGDGPLRGRARTGCRSACSWPPGRGRTRSRCAAAARRWSARWAGSSRLRYGRGLDRAPRRTDRIRRDADRALAGAADRVPRGLPAALRRRVQRHVQGLQDAAGDRLARPRSIRALYARARAPHAARAGR